MQLYILRATRMVNSGFLSVVMFCTKNKKIRFFQEEDSFSGGGVKHFVLDILKFLQFFEGFSSCDRGAYEEWGGGVAIEKNSSLVESRNFTFKLYYGFTNHDGGAPMIMPDGRP